MIQCRLCNFSCNILGKPNAASRTVLMNIDALYLTPPVVTSKLQFQNTLIIATVLSICYLSQLKHLDMNAILSGKHARCTSFKAKTIEPLGINKRDELAWLCNRYLFFGLFFSAATPYHVIPCIFCLLLHSSIYSVYSWFFLKNVMKTGIGQSK